MSSYYAQAIAEELNVRPETISLILGDTDRTPDGGYSAGFIFGMANVARSQRIPIKRCWGWPLRNLAFRFRASLWLTGVVSGGGKSLSYGHLVQGQHLDLKIPIIGKLAKVDRPRALESRVWTASSVTGDPPMKPMSQFR